MKEFSKHWKSSKLPRKQRKYRAKAPLHVRQKLVAAALSKELRAKHKRRSVVLKVGDKVRILRGDYAKKEGKVERISLRAERLYVAGVSRVKKDGSSALYPIHPSNVQVLELNLDDKFRTQKLAGGQR